MTVLTRSPDGDVVHRGFRPVPAAPGFGLGEVVGVEGGDVRHAFRGAGFRGEVERASELPVVDAVEEVAVMNQEVGSAASLWAMTATVRSRGGRCASCVCC